jgi:hypothetical protein
MPLSLDDIRHLDAADSWLERRDYVNCFHELERIDCNNRDDSRVLALQWRLYNETRQHICAADVALVIQRRFPDEPEGYVWRAVSLSKLGAAPEAYDCLKAVAARFDGLGVVPYTLAVLAAQMQRIELAHDWLAKAYATPEGPELKLLSLEEKELDGFWPKIGAIG